jgi:hypothetical protein
LSSRPIPFDHWIHIEISRRGHTAALTVTSEDPVASVDRVEEPLPRHDEAGRPFGAVFNLHSEYSKV